MRLARTVVGILVRDSSTILFFVLLEEQPSLKYFFKREIHTNTVYFLIQNRLQIQPRNTLKVIYLMGLVGAADLDKLG